MPISDAPFEEPLNVLRQKIQELESYPEGTGHDKELRKLRTELDNQTQEVFANLSRWDKTLLARHSDRPYTLDYAKMLFDDWIEIHGDRHFADDAAIVAGLGRFSGRPVAVVGHQKGRGTKERIQRNFGQPRPEGYRKALRVMHLAAKFALPVISLIDTPGAYPGIGAEERGQAEAIARNLLEMARLPVPVVVVVTGEGGSGGALALGVGDRVFMLEYSVYSVISPEGCAAILWRDQDKKQEAAEAMRISAPDLLQLGVIDKIIAEPKGGAHTDPSLAAERVGEAIAEALEELTALPLDRLLEERYQRFRKIGFFEEGR